MIDRIRSSHAHPHHRHRRPHHRHRRHRPRRRGPDHHVPAHGRAPSRRAEEAGEEAGRAQAHPGGGDRGRSPAAGPRPADARRSKGRRGRGRPDEGDRERRPAGAAPPRGGGREGEQGDCSHHGRSPEAQARPRHHAAHLQGGAVAVRQRGLKPARCTGPMFPM